MAFPGTGASNGLEQDSANYDFNDETLYNDFRGASDFGRQSLSHLAGPSATGLSFGYGVAHQDTTLPAPVAQQNYQTYAAPWASQVGPESLFVPEYNSDVQPAFHIGLTDPGQVLHTGLTDPEQVVHTGFTDPEQGFHTGLTDPNQVTHTGFTDPEQANNTGFSNPKSLPFPFGDLNAQQIYPGTIQNQASFRAGSVFPLPTPTNLVGFPGSAGLNGEFAPDTLDPSRAFNASADAPSLDAAAAAAGFERIFEPAAQPAFPTTLDPLPRPRSYPPQGTQIPRPALDSNGQWILVFDPLPASAAADPQQPLPGLALRNGTTFATPSFSQHRATRPLPPPPPHARVQPQTKPPAPSRPVQTSNFNPEQPQRDQERPWVRANARNNAQGSTRTGKITQYKPHEAYSVPNAPLHGPWVGPTSNKVFEYNSYGELKELQYTAAQLQDYILNYAPTPNARLKVWIQRAPADSARRQPTSGSSKCRMTECPASIYDSTITVGSFRLALDEQWYTHGMKKDPHVCAAFIHLYCAERFLNFKLLAQHVDIEPDTRLFNTEPNARFAASLSQMASANDAAEFLALARAPNSLEFDVKWANYPAAPVPPGEPFEDAHAHTLNCRMFRTKNGRMNKSKLKMLRDRGVRRSTQLAHLGDVEKAVKARRGATVRRRRFYDILSDDDEDGDRDAPPRKRTRHARVKIETPSTGDSQKRRAGQDATAAPDKTSAARSQANAAQSQTSPAGSQTSPAGSRTSPPRSQTRSQTSSVRSTTSPPRSTTSPARSTTSSAGSQTGRSLRPRRGRSYAEQGVAEADSESGDSLESLFDK